MAESKRGVVASLLSKLIDALVIVFLVNAVIASAGLVDWPWYRVIWPLYVVAGIGVSLLLMIGVGGVAARIGGER